MSNDRSTEREILRAALGPGNECPPVEDLDQVRTGRISPSTALAKHVHSCSYCQSEMQMLQAFYAGDEGQPSEEVKQIVCRLQANSKSLFRKPAPVNALVSWWEGAFSMRRFAQASLALAAILIIAAAALRLHTVKSASIEALNQTGHEVFRTGSFDLLEPVGDLQEPPKEIRWQKVDDAETYQVRLLEVDRSEIWKAETKENHIDLPSPIRIRIVPAKTLFCEVDAFNSVGTKVSGTGLIRFRLVQNATDHH